MIDLKEKFRVAYTSDNCLLIYGLQALPVELNADQTTELVEFISEQVTLLLC